MPDFQYGEDCGRRTPSKEQGIAVRKSPHGAESGQLGGGRARSARFSLRELLPRGGSLPARRVQLADRSGPDRLDRSARARRLPRGAVRHPDHERRAPAREPGLDREHRGLRREEAPSPARQLDDGQGHGGRPLDRPGARREGDRGVAARDRLARAAPARRRRRASPAGSTARSRSVCARAHSGRSGRWRC